MNALGQQLVWTALQVSLLALVGAALYAIVRQRNPAAGAWVAFATVAIAMLLPALAAVAWPSWWTADEPAAQLAQPLASTATLDSAPLATTPAPAHDAPPDELASPAPALPTAAKRDPAPATSTSWAELWARFRWDMTSSTATAVGSAWSWPAWVALAILGCSAIGLLRLLVAIVAAERFRRQARPLDDASLVEQLEVLRASIGCRRAIELREAAGVGSPATLGWLRPAILLPADWRAWSDAQRQAVLAHEVAHVERGDFLVALAAQLSVVVHFYNPLVHWLAGRLRLEQELAADACGALHAGGRQSYLTVLAEMALRQAQPTMAWAAHPFLPTRGTLMRRIEMLHARELPTNVTISRRRRLVLATALLGVALLVAGLRSPAARRAVAAGPKDAQPPISLDFVPSDTIYLLAIRPSELDKLASLATLKQALMKTSMFEPLDLPLSEIEECKFLAAGPSAASPAQAWGMLVLRSKQPHDWTKLASYFLGKTEQAAAAGQVYFRSTASGPARSTFGEYWLPDDRTIVFASAGKVVETFSLRGALNAPPWAQQWNTRATGPAAAVLRADMLQGMLGDLGSLEPGSAAIFAGREQDGVFLVDGNLAARSPEAAKQLAARLQAGLAKSRASLETFLKQPGSAGIPQIALSLVNATKIETSGTAVASHTAIAPTLGSQLTASIAPAREEARRNASANKMKMLGIALQNYHDAYRTFPPAVIIGPDGKTPHSWRVALLPFLDKNDLYQRYNKNEPWDSEHNKQLIQEAADLYSVPSEGGNQDCGYFLIVGPGTIFDPAEAKHPIRSIRDGTSRTIGLVEAKRSIPWTKPEDIEYDPDKPIPPLGGFSSAGFLAGFADAHVEMISKDADEAALRALFTRDGRERVEIEDGKPKLLP